MNKPGQSADPRTAEKKRPPVNPAASQSEEILTKELPHLSSLYRTPTVEAQAEAIQRFTTTTQRQEAVQDVAEKQGNEHATDVVQTMRSTQPPTTPSVSRAPISTGPSVTPAAATAAKPVSRTASRTVQTKLSVSEPGDPYEVEADRVADEVMRMPAPATPPPPPADAGSGDGASGAGGAGAGGNGTPSDPAEVRRSLLAPLGLQASSPAKPDVSQETERGVQRLKGSGQPLPKTDREFFESRMNADFGDVRVHTGDNAQSTSEELNARAYTVGSDVAFNRGEYNPGTGEGRRLLAHELTHVIQQGGAGELERKPVPDGEAKINRCMTGSCRAEEAQLKSDTPGKIAASSTYRADKVSLKATAHTSSEKINRCADASCRAEATQLKADATETAGTAFSATPLVQAKVKVNRCITGVCRAEETQHKEIPQRKAMIQRKENHGARPTLSISAKGAADIQRWPNWDDVKNAAGDVWDATGGQVVDAAGDVIDDVASWGADRFFDFVGSISPELADLIRNGPIEMLTTSIQTGIQGWLTSILGSVDLSSVVGNLMADFTHAITIVQGVLNNDPACCATFADTIQKLGDFAQGFLDNPVIQGIQSAFEQANSTFTELTTTLLSPLFDTIMNAVGDVFGEIQGLANTVWGWAGAVKDALGAAWDWVKEQLGLASDGAAGVLDWLKTKATEAWSSITETLGPISGPLQTIVGAIALATPVGWALVIAPKIPQLVEAVQWLWANKDNPNIIEDAHEEMGHTILPQLLEAGQGFGDDLVAGVTQFATEIEGLGTAFVSLLEAVSGVPLVSIASGLIQTLSDGIQELTTWIQDVFQTVAQDVQTLIQNVKVVIEPYKEVLCSIGMAILNPGMIPTILMGWAWRMLPDCVKAPIINFLLDLVIRLLEEAPDLPMFGLLWPLLKSAVIGFLAGVRSQPDDVKVTVTNRLAKILSGASPEFLLGFVRGFLRGIWEGITDPFMLIYYAITGLGNLVSWLNDMAQQALIGDEDDQEEISEDDVQAQLTQEMQGMAGDLQPPVNEVTGGFMPAVEEFFTGGDGMTLEELSAKMGEAWQGLLDGISGAAGQLAQSIMDFLMQDGAEGDMGDTIGWLAGTIVFEVILGILTAGSVTTAKGLMKPLKIFAKILDWTGEALGLAFKALGKVAGFLMDMVRGLGKLLSNAGGAIGRVLGALQEIAEIIMGKVDELLGLTRRMGDDVLEEGAEHGAREGAEETAERAAKKAAELPLAMAQSITIIEANDVINLPVPILLTQLDTLKARYDWINGFQAEPKGVGEYLIVMLASRHPLSTYTVPPGGFKLGKHHNPAQSWDSVKFGSKGGKTTIVDGTFDVTEDIRLINEGKAQVLPNNRFEVNGRIYGHHGDGRSGLFPVKGSPGTITLDGLQFQILKALKSGNLTAIQARLSKGIITQSQVDAMEAILRVFQSSP